MRKVIIWNPITIFHQTQNWHIDARFMHNDIIIQLNQQTDVSRIITSERLRYNCVQRTKINNCPKATASGTVNNKRSYFLIPSKMFCYFYHMESNAWTTLNPIDVVSSFCLLTLFNKKLFSSAESNVFIIIYVQFIASFVSPSSSWYFLIRKSWTKRKKPCWIIH